MAWNVGGAFAWLIPFLDLAISNSFSRLSSKNGRGGECLNIPLRCYRRSQKLIYFARCMSMTSFLKPSHIIRVHETEALTTGTIGVPSRTSQESTYSMKMVTSFLKKQKFTEPPLKAIVNTVGGLLASRRVFCWLP